MVDEGDFDKTVKTAAEAQRARDRDDLQHEISGQDTGRLHRFLSDRVKDKAEKKRRQEQTDRLLTELDRWLQNPEYKAQYEAFGNFLVETESTVESALDEAQNTLGEAREQLQSALDKANLLPDRTKVFRTADGRVMDENGNEISAEDAAGIVWKDGAPTYEEYLDAKQRAEGAQRLVDDMRRFQTDVLGGARNRWEDRDNPITPEEMDKARKQIEQSMKDIGISQSEPNAPSQPASTTGLSLPTSIPPSS